MTLPWWPLILLEVAPAPSAHVPAALDSAVAAHSFRVEWNGTPSGPGMTLLLDQARRAQFVALAEEHNAQEIPELATALFRRLHSEAGFEFMALEQDPLTMQLSSRPPRRGRADSVVALARRYPHAFTFISDQELGMIAEVGRISGTRAEALWGCDQAFGATHLLDALLTTPMTAGARGFVRALRDSAAAAERVRDLSRGTYLGREIPLLASLRDRVRPATGSRADFLIGCLEQSNRIYSAYRERRYYENGSVREDYMKQRFMEEYRRAEKADGRPPRVVLKLGHWHLFRGLGPSSLQTLGNFVSEFARANGSEALVVALFPLGEPGAYGDLGRWTDPGPALLARSAGPRDWTLVDLRALREGFPRITRELSFEQREAVRRWVFGFDLGLFIRGIHRATYDLNPGISY